MQELFTILYAQTAFLKSECTSLLVKSIMADAEVTRHYKMFERESHEALCPALQSWRSVSPNTKVAKVPEAKMDVAEDIKGANR